MCELARMPGSWRAGLGSIGATGGRFLLYLQQGWLGALQWVSRVGPRCSDRSEFPIAGGIQAESVTWRRGLVETEGWMRGSKFMTSKFPLTLKSWDILLPHCLPGWPAGDPDGDHASFTCFPR